MATFYILKKNDLVLLKNGSEADPGKRKGFFSRKKKPADAFVETLESTAVEKFKYKWADLSLVILAVFSKERLKADWHYLEYNGIANELTEKYEAGVYIFSGDDKGMMKLKPNGYFYPMHELDQFAATFEGSKPNNPNLMRNAAKFLDEVLSKLTSDTVALLVLEN